MLATIFSSQLWYLSLLSYLQKFRDLRDNFKGLLINHSNENESASFSPRNNSILTGDLVIGGIVGLASLMMSSKPCNELPISTRASDPSLWGARKRAPVCGSEKWHLPKESPEEWFEMWNAELTNSFLHVNLQITFFVALESKWWYKDNIT